ncbi:MAG: hypothetical protein H0T75_15805 [Rhizobiales bacterium]|nr:hypothetical protein [Hyphomicrobiales bacterium]
MKGIDTGIMREPMLRAFIQEAAPPMPFYEHAAGRWAAEREWPSAAIAMETLHLGRAGLSSVPQRPEHFAICSPQTTGMSGGEWCPFGTGPGPDFPTDQREDDGRSLVFDSQPLTERMEILGHVIASVEVASDKSTAFIAVRICDVAPDGASSRVTYGVLNLSHREGHEMDFTRSTGRAVSDRGSVECVRLRFSAGSPVEARHFHRILASDLADAGTGHDDALVRGERLAPACPPKRRLRCAGDPRRTRMRIRNAAYSDPGQPLGAPSGARLCHRDHHPSYHAR